MTKVSIFHVPTVLVCTLCFSCAGTKARIAELNKPVIIEKGEEYTPEIKFKKAKVMYHNGKELRLDNVILNQDSALLFVSDTINKSTISLSDLQSLELSNSHKGAHGAVIGGFSGLLISGLLLKDKLKGNNNRNNNNRDVPFPVIPVKEGLDLAYTLLITLPLGVGLGYFLGSKFQNWKEYDLTPKTQNMQSLYFDTNTQILRYELKIPFQ